MFSTKYWYHCIECGSNQDPDQPYYECPECRGLLLVKRDLDYLKKCFPTPKKFMTHFTKMRSGILPYPMGSGVWQWMDLILPDFPASQAISLHEGNTDLWELPDHAKAEFGLKHLFFKKEGDAPSGSFKDRGMPVAISEAMRLGKRYVICASTGDTSASAAMYSAYRRDRLTCIVLVPHNKVTPAQLYQVIDAGAKVLAIDSKGGFDDCMKVVAEFAKVHPEIVLVNSKNPMRIVGQESISLEIFADFHYKTPDWIVIPTGNGGNVTAQMNAWLLLSKIGIISADQLPGIIMAQPQKANTLVRWLESGKKVFEPGEPSVTQASAANIQRAVSLDRIEYLSSKFRLVAYDVAEQDIGETRARFNQLGAGLCTQGALAASAVLQARQDGTIKETDNVVAITTANDLKFVDAGIEYHQAGKGKYCNSIITLPPTVQAVEQALELSAAS